MSDLVACHECDLLNRVQPLPPRGRTLCAPCSAPLFGNKPDSLEQTLALTVAVLILFAVANAFPFLGMKSGWLVRENTLASRVQLLYAQGMYGLATLVALTCLVVPGLQLLVLLHLLVPLKLGRVAGRPPVPPAGPPATVGHSADCRER